MDVRSSTVESVAVVTLTGDLDSTSAPGVQARLESMVAPEGHMLVDLSGVPYMSSAGLRTLLLVYRMAQTVNTSVGLVGISADLRAMMSATGFLSFFTVDDTVADGVAGVAGTARKAAQ